MPKKFHLILFRHAEDFQQAPTLCMNVDASPAHYTRPTWIKSCSGVTNFNALLLGPPSRVGILMSSS